MSEDSKKHPRGRPWAKGTSGNPRGRPPKSSPVDPSKILLEELTVNHNGRPCQMSVTEIGVRKMIEAALKGRIEMIGKVLDAAVGAGLFVPPPEVSTYAVYHIPKEWEHDAWKAMYDEHGPPPWPGERDGLVPEERLAARS